MQCPACHTENPSANRFCDQCGEALDARCPQCSAVLRAGARLLHLGIAIWINSSWLIVTLIATVAFMIVAVIRTEERYLEERFGADYVEDKTSVRRWL